MTGVHAICSIWNPGWIRCRHREMSLAIPTRAGPLRAGGVRLRTEGLEESSASQVLPGACGGGRWSHAVTLPRKKGGGSLFLCLWQKGRQRYLIPSKNTWPWLLKISWKGFSGLASKPSGTDCCCPLGVWVWEGAGRGPRLPSLALTTASLFKCCSSDTSSLLQGVSSPRANSSVVSVTQALFLG